MKYENWTITPEKAKQLLERNRNCRNASESKWKEYSAQMKRGEWIEEYHDPIIIRRDGSVANGQHRLWAIIDSGVTLRFRVLLDVDEEYIQKVDGGRPRRLHERYTFGPHALRPRQILISVAKRIAASDKSLKDLSEQQLVDLTNSILPHMELILPFIRSGHSGLDKAWLLHAFVEFLQRHHEKAREFIGSFYEVDGPVQQARVLRDFVLRHKGVHARIIDQRLYGYAILAFRHHLIGRRVSVLNRCATWDSEIDGGAK